MCVCVCVLQRVTETLVAAETFWRRSASSCRTKPLSWRSVAVQTDSYVLVVLMLNELVCQSVLWDCGLVCVDSSERGDSAEGHKIHNIKRVLTQPGTSAPRQFIFS